MMYWTVVLQNARFPVLRSNDGGKGTSTKIELYILYVNNDGEYHLIYNNGLIGLSPKTNFIN